MRGNDLRRGLSRNMETQATLLRHSRGSHGVGFAARLHKTERFEIVPWPAVLGAIEIRIKEKDNAE